MKVMGPRQWAVKIRDRERVEPPHVTLLRKTLVLRIIEVQWQVLCDAWDEMYPENPVEVFDD